MLHLKLDDTVRYVNDTAQKVEFTAERIFNDLTKANEAIMESFKELEAKQCADRVAMNMNAEHMQEQQLELESHKHCTKQTFAKQLADYNRKITSLKLQQEITQIKVAQKLTDEFQYLNRRLRQKLLYQIGLTDDPW